MTALALDRTRLGNLLGMTGSNQDGEAPNAARLADKMVRAAGLTWHQVLAPAEAPQRHNAPHDWRDLVRQCRAQPGSLRPWERGFLAGLDCFPRLSPKQRRVLDEIADRLGFARTAA